MWFLLSRVPWFCETAFVLLHTVPVLYEKYEDQVDSFAEKATAEFKKQYAVFDAKVLSKIPKGPLKDRKKDWSGWPLAVPGTDEYFEVGCHQGAVIFGSTIS